MYRLIHKNIMVTAKEKCILYTQKKSKKIPKYNIKVVIKSYEKGTKEKERNKKDIRKIQHLNEMNTHINKLFK